MNFDQNFVLRTLENMHARDVADISFSTAVTQVLQERAREYKSSDEYKRSLRPLGTTNQRVVPAGKLVPKKPVAEPKVKTPAAPKKMTIAQREAATRAWVGTNIATNMIVQMNGTRDKHGIRKVVRIDYSARLLTCVAYGKVDASLASSFTGRSLIQIDGQLYVEMKQTTVHDMGKVACVFSRAGNRLYRINPKLQ